MSLEDNKTVIRRFLEEAIVQGNLDVIDTSFAPHLVHHIRGTLHNHAGLRKQIQELNQAFSGQSLTIHEIIAEGDTVVARMSYTATHHSLFGNNLPIGQVQMECINVFHFEQGKVTEGWFYYEGADIDFSSFGQ
jgi:predicted ester cyclase